MAMASKSNVQNVYKVYKMLFLADWLVHLCTHIVHMVSEIINAANNIICPNTKCTPLAKSFSHKNSDYAYNNYSAM